MTDGVTCISRLLLSMLTYLNTVVPYACAYSESGVVLIARYGVNNSPFSPYVTGGFTLAGYGYNEFPLVGDTFPSNVPSRGLLTALLRRPFLLPSSNGMHALPYVVLWIHAPLVRDSHASNGSWLYCAWMRTGVAAQGPCSSVCHNPISYRSRAKLQLKCVC